MKKKCLNKILVMLISVLFFMSFSTVNADNKKVIRVGYPEMPGLSMKDDEGNYYGYDYDYLMQIAQYTGWEYEFVEVEGNENEQITKLMEMLKDGEIDLLGDTRYFEQLTNDYDYTSEPYGSSYNILAVKNDSDLMDTNSLLTKEDLKIGAFRTASSRKAVFEQFAQTNGISYTLVDCEDENDLYKKYENHEVDAALISDFSLLPGFHSIAKFSPSPFYYITTKGNTQIINELNHALTNINKITPTLSSDLYNRYFIGDTKEFVLNASEQNYLKNNPDINVLVCNGSSPIRYGVGMDILKKLSKDTGVTFHYTFAKTFEECKKKALSDTYDIVLGLPYEIRLSETMNVRMSDPFLTSNVLLITNKNISPSDLEGKKQALTPYSVTIYDNNTNLHYYESIEEILDAVNRHDVDYAYSNTYMYTYYLNKHNYKNLSNFNTAEYLRTQYVFGITKTEDLSLLSIVNKSIRIQKEDIESYIYKNAYVEKEFSLSAFIFDHIIVIGFSTLLLILVIIYFIRSYYRKQLQMKKAIELEYMRYQLLSDLSGEVSFTYDYINDSMKISAIGLGKLADQKLISNFTNAIQDTHLYPDILRVIASYLQQAKDVTCEEETRILHNSDKWYQLSIKIIEDVRNNKTTAIYAVGKVVDIQKEKEERELLRIKSETDILTGILNRGAAQDEIEKLIESQHGCGALLIMDLDNFKEVNDIYGHLEGDRVLIEAANLLNKIFDGHIVARLGGDEFIIYISDTNHEEVSSLCHKTMAQIKNLECLKNHKIQLSISIGISFTTFSTDFITLVKNADQMLYDVKRNGRNNFKFYENQK